MLVSIFTVRMAKISDSDSVQPLSQKAAETFVKENSSSVISVTGSGGGVVVSVLSSTVDIARAFGMIKVDEKLRLKAASEARWL